MVYKPNIPTPSNSPKNQASEIQENFSQLDTIMDVDHYKYSDSEPYVGMHKAVRYREQSADPNTIDAQIALYTKEDDTGDLSFFIRGENDGPVIQASSAEGGGGGGFDRPGLAAAVLFQPNGAIISSNNVASVSKNVISDPINVEYTITYTSAIPADCYLSPSMTTRVYPPASSTFMPANVVVTSSTTTTVVVNAVFTLPFNEPPPGTDLFDFMNVAVWRPVNV